MGNKSLYLSTRRERRELKRRELVLAGNRRKRSLIATTLALALVIAGAPAMASADEGYDAQSEVTATETASQESEQPAAPEEEYAPEEPAVEEETTPEEPLPPADEYVPEEPALEEPEAAEASEASEAYEPEVKDEPEVDPYAEPSPSPSPSESSTTTLTLIKVVWNDNGGQADPSAWMLQVSQDGETWQTLDQETATTLEPGTWYVRETGGPEGYVLFDFYCDAYDFDSEEMTVTLKAGDDATCTFTNDDQDTWFDLGITKTHGELPVNGGVEAGDEFDWTITVTNFGPGTSTPALVTDDIPEGLTVLGVTSSQGTASFVGNHVEVDLPALPPLPAADATVTVTVSVKVNPDPPAEPAAFAPPGTTPPEVEALPEDFVNTACVEAEGETETETEAGTPEHENCAEDTVPRKAIVARVWVSCINDAPFLMYEVKTTSNLDGLPITLTWKPTTGSGVVPAQVSMQVQPNVVTRLDWPGVTWDSAGVSIDWPGWRPLQPSDLGPNGLPLPGLEVYGTSVRDTSEPDEAWRQPTLVTFSVNPQFASMAVYPPGTPQCAVPAVAVLAATGGGDDSGALMTLAALTLFGGAALLGWGRRRRWVELAR